MKHLDSTDIDQLLKIIKVEPSIRIMHLSDGDLECNRQLAGVAGKHGYEFDIRSLSESDYTESLKHFGTHKGITVSKLRLTQPRFSSQAKLYDYLFITAEIQEDMQENLLSRSYESLKSGGLILIIEEENEENLWQRWGHGLESSYFVAANTIPLSGGHSVIIARKMHGWGG